jgi:predicted metal-dependent HD superfamily phosphohydrolase
MTGSHRSVLAQLAKLPPIARILARLARDLPSGLRYHGIEHTRDVLSEVVLFALHDGIGAHERELLSLAAAYHDAGYMDRYADNEVIGAAMAADAMRAAGGYSDADVREVGEMILSTQLLRECDGTARVQRTPLAAYLMDADWGAFGRDDFFAKCELLIAETGAEPTAFYRQTLALVRSQSWLTKAGRELRDAKKRENLAELERRLRADGR